MIYAIAAIGLYNEIGYNNKLIWKLPTDMKYFKNLTTGHAVLMGRKTFESIGGVLKNRINFVLSSNKDQLMIKHGRDYLNEELYFLRSYNSALSMMQVFKKDERKHLFIIGGEQIYNEFIDFCDGLFITQIEDRTLLADTYFPEINSKFWDLSSSLVGLKDEKNPYNYTFKKYLRSSYVE